jgi:uncharacterized membrane protein YphA (DoxX/SURF4 family)
MDRFLNPLFMAPLIACLFFTVLFLQSGLDKVFDWKGNVGWMTPHFEKSPFRGLVPLLLGVLTVLEVATGALSSISAVILLFSVDSAFRWYSAAMILAALTLTMLFAGQRLAKDYAGASTIAIYFGVVLLALGFGSSLSAAPH